MYMCMCVCVCAHVSDMCTMAHVEIKHNFW